MLPKILRPLSPIAFVAAAFTLFAPAPLVAQATSSLVTTRLTQPIDENSTITLKGTVSPLARAANDHGAAPDSMALSRLTLVLKRSDAQESALKSLINDMHTPGSASYHKWLTPDQFGKQFGPSDQDLATVEAWLQSHGFGITKVNGGRQSIEISGNVAQFRTAFHSQIHKYMINGEIRYANATDPQIPAALAPVIGGFATLNNFPVKNNLRKLGEATYDTKSGKATPQWTIGSASTGYEFALSPGDYAVQYDLNPLYQASTPINGTGQTIAIVNDSNINVYLVNQFRTLFGLPANPPQVIIDGNDPGVNGDSIEAYLDVEWSGAVAPNANIDLVIGADTALEGGLFLALQHAIYGNIAPVVSLSFGSCENALGTTNQFLNSLYEQAAAQGITVVVSTGDSGSAACDDDNTQYYAINGQQVSGFASTPYNVAVGGTDFYYSAWNQGSAALNAQLQSYWNFTPSNNTPMVTIQGVIPEQPWNDSQYGLNINNYYDESGQTATTIAAGSGGASNCATGTYDSSGNTISCTAGYAKPVWQTGTGVPSDSVRDIPDLSLFAADGSANASFYPICATDGDCQPVSSGNTVQIFAVGGTSASTPSFAGIMALINQKYGPQGQADFVLYPLAAQFPAAFHDVTHGTNSVPCAFLPTSPNCINESSITVTDPNLGTATEGQIGTGTTVEYNATTGYDLSSGLGTLDANVLFNNWNKVTFAPSTVTLSSPTAGTYAHGSTVNVSATVTGSSPTGNVALMTTSTEPTNQGIANFTLNSSGAASGSTVLLPGGTYNVWAHYGGDSKNAQADSAKTQVTVTPEASGVFLNVIDVADNVLIPSGTTNIPYGTALYFSAQVAPSSKLAALESCFTSSSACPVFGIPTGVVTFFDNTTKVNTAVLNAEGDAEYNTVDQTVAVSATSVGTHSITASYAGDASYNASTASATTYTIAKAQVGGFFVTWPNTNILAGQATAVTLLLDSAGTGAPPTGTIAISGAPSGTPTSVPLSYYGVDLQTGVTASYATFTIPASAGSGNYNVTLTYNGDANYLGASASGTLGIAAASALKPTTTVVTTTMSATSPTTLVGVTITVTGSGTTPPTGTVTLETSGYVFNPLTLVPATGTDHSSVSIGVDSQGLLQGANVLTAGYSGDTNYAPSSSAAVNLANPLSDFAIVPETTIVPVNAGSSGTDTINAFSVNSFAGAVSFTCTATTVTCNVSSSATLSAGSNAPLTLTINAGSSVATGNYNVLVTGKDSTGTYIHTLAIQAAVTGASTPGFALSASPTTLNLTAGATTGNTSTISVTPSNGFTGTVDLTCVVTPPSGTITSPATCTLNPTSPDVTSGAVTSTLTVDSAATTTPGSYTVKVTGMSGTITETTTVTVTVTAPATPTFTLSSAPTTLDFVAGATTGNTSTISVTPSNGFTGNVALACSVTGPAGAISPAICALAPPTADITGTAAVTSVLTVTTTSTTTPGTYTVTTTGTAGTITQMATVTVTVTALPVPGFTLSANPTTLSLVAGATTGNTSTISVTPSNGFTGSVPLTCSVTGPTGATSPATCALSPTSANITGSAAVTSTLTVATTATTTPGNYTVTTTGTLGSITSNGTVTVTVTAPPAPTFALSNSGSITVTQGASGMSTISVTPANGFTGTVNLACSSSNSAQVTCSVPTSVDVTGSSTVTATLSVTAGSNSAALDRPLNKFFAIGGGATLALLVFFGIPARRRSWRAILGVVLFGAIVGLGIGCGSSGSSSASYTVTVTGTSGTLSESTTVSVTVNK